MIRFKFLIGNPHMNTPRIHDSVALVNHFDGRLKHRECYSDTDWQATADWLNERNAGYPAKKH